MEKVQILLVEDESIEAMDIKQTVQSFGYEVQYTASRGEEALEKAQELLPDLILIDIILKGEMDGIEVCSEIKKLNIPFIYLTAHSEESTFQKALKTEPYGYVLKPFDPVELKYAIEMALYKKEMEKKLSESQDTFHLLTETLDDIIYVVDLKKQKIIYISSACQKITGWETESFYQNPELWMEMMHPEDRPKVTSHISNLQDEGKEKKIEYRIQTRNGDTKWISESFKVIFNEKNQPTQVIGHAADVTLKKESEKLLKKSEKRYRNLVDKAMVGVFRSNLKGDIVFANEAMAHMFSYDNVEDLKANNIQRLYKNHEERKSIIRTLKEDGFLTNHETDAVGKNGEVIRVLVSMNLDGDIISGMFMDITELKQTEEKLDRSERRYRTIFENSGVLLLTFDNDGNIIMFNSEWAEISGYSREEVEGKMKWMDFVHPEYLEKMVKYHRQRMKYPDSVPQKYETVFISKNGDQHVMYISVTALPGTGKWLASGTDITDLKKTQKKLEKNVLFSRALTENALDGIITTNTLGKILYFNNSLLEMFGYSKGELKNSPITLLMPERYHENFTEILKKFQDTGEHRLVGRTIETIGLKKDGKEFPFEMSLTKWEIEDQIYFTSIIRDITERKKGEENRIKGEKALAEKEEKYHALMDYSSDTIILADLNGNFIECNQKAGELLGLLPDEILKLNFRDIHPPEELEKVQKYFNKAISGDMGIVETLVLTKDNNKVPVAITASMVQYGDTRVIQGIFRDISERKNAEKALSESEKKYRTLFESDPNYAILIAPDGKLVDVNTAAEQITGISKEELIGKSFNELGIFIEEELGLHGEMFAQTLKHGAITPYRARIIDKNGQIRWVLNQSAAVTNDNNLYYVLVIGQDITEYKKAEDALKESEENLRFLTDNMNDVIGQIDAEGIITYFSPSLKQLTGYEPQELVGKKSADLVHPEDQETILNALREGIINKKPITIEYRTKKSDGDYIWLEASGKAVNDLNGNFKSAVFVARDISDRKKADNVLKESLNEKEVLLREIHHRVKNNMQIISSLLNLQIQFEDTEEIADVLKESQGRVKTMAMVHEKLYQSDSLSKINFRDYIKNLVSQIFYSYGVKNGLIGLEMDIENFNIGIDTAIPLGLIVNELITNSVKYAFPEGRKGVVKIIFKSENHNNFLIISDDGIGISDDINPEKTESLGLQLVNNLTNQIDGEIELDTNKGTEFRIKFKELEYKDRF